MASDGDDCRNKIKSQAYDKPYDSYGTAEKQPNGLDIVSLLKTYIIDYSTSV